MEYEKQEVHSASIDGLGSPMKLQSSSPIFLPFSRCSVKSPKICSLLFQGNVDCLVKQIKGPDAHSICITLYYIVYKQLPIYLLKKQIIAITSAVVS